ncbi:MAG TPA: hypothetical protein VHG91_09985 [Longimicrobium sp.]|nr:hypothetical protein [Longimicrobium sp.]
MKSYLPLLAAALLLAPAHDLAAQDRHGSRVEITDGSHGRMGPRRALADADFAITTTNQKASLMLVDGMVAMQLTDRTLREITRDMDRDAREDADDGFLARTIANAVRNSVGSMLRRSFQYPVADIESVEYRRGRLVFTTEDGDEIFRNVEVDDDELMETFSPADAQAFVREFRALKARTR